MAQHRITGRVKSYGNINKENQTNITNRCISLSWKDKHLLWKNIISKMCWQQFNYYPCILSSTIQNRNQNKMNYVIVLFMNYNFSVHG